MKLNVTINLEDLFIDAVENAGYDEFGVQVDTDLETQVKEQLKEEVIQAYSDSLKKKVSSNLEVRVNEELEKQIEEQVKPKVDTWIKEFYDKKRIVVKDSWGSNVKEYSTQEFIQKHVDDYMKGEIDSRSRDYGSRKVSRLEYIIETQVKEMTEKHFDKYKKEQEKIITGALQNAIAEHTKTSFNSRRLEEAVKKAIADLEKGE